MFEHLLKPEPLAQGWMMHQDLKTYTKELKLLEDKSRQFDVTEECQQKKLPRLLKCSPNQD